MNLQLFAEDVPDGEGDEPQDKGGNGGAAQTYTAEEVMKLIQHFVHLANAPIEDIKSRILHRRQRAPLLRGEKARLFRRS